MNMTQINANISYYGMDDSVVNASLSDIGKWDKDAIILLCKRKYVTLRVLTLVGITFCEIKYPHKKSTF